MHGRYLYACAALSAALLLLPASARSQPPASGDPAPASPQAPQEPPMDHDHMHMDGMDMNGGWHFMQDGVVYGLFNHQGGSRGSDEFKAPNWWMGMWSRPLGAQQLTLTSMLSLDRATLGPSGYAELFQTGETLDGQPLVDRQHPHDFFMQLSAAWRIPVGDATTLTLSGGPAAAPALGPIAFMHRASAAENPTAPLGHHTFDSTHISFGVVTAGVTHAKWTLEGSVFNGREPDENRWDLDLGPLDSYSGRLWFRPDDHWELQASTGKLTDPEELEPGDVVRTTFSASWLQSKGNGLAATAGFGMNRHDEENHQSAFAEATWRGGRNAIYGRLELHEPETALLLADSQAPTSVPEHSSSLLVAFTAGAVRDVATIRGFNVGIGGDITAYGVPEVLRGAYGRPVSFHLFLRVRLPAIGGSMAM